MIFFSKYIHILHSAASHFNFYVCTFNTVNKVLTNLLQLRRAWTSVSKLLDSRRRSPCWFVNFSEYLPVQFSCLLGGNSCIHIVRTHPSPPSKPGMGRGVGFIMKEWMPTHLFQILSNSLTPPPLSPPHFAVTSNPHHQCSFCCLVSLVEWVIIPHLMWYLIFR